MSALATVQSEGVSWSTLEKVLGSADIEALTPQQTVEYLANVCRSLGLNPLTRPIRIMSLQGKKVPYATKDCADQLRALRSVSLAIAGQRIEDDLFIVTVRATMPGGRSDEDMGAVTIGSLRGDARANAIMKAITKAKRRATLSICGLGFLDETEVDDIHGAVKLDSRPAPVVKPEPAIPAPAPNPLSGLAARLAVCATVEDVERVNLAWTKSLAAAEVAGRAVSEELREDAKRMFAERSDWVSMTKEPDTDADGMEA